MAKALSKSQVAAEIAEKAGLKKKQAAEILELIAQGAAMCAEDGVVLGDVLATSATVEEALEAFTARRAPRVGMVLGNSLQLAVWEIHPETPGADPGRVMGQTLHALCEPA